MKDLPAVLDRGERARLFPVLADTSKEGRTLSIFLACLQNVGEFARSLLDSVDVRVGARAKIETFTEVHLKKQLSAQGFRPDGLIVVTVGSKSWTALVEAKVGNSDLTNAQIEAYLDLAKLNGVDAVITLSNQFAPLPTHHPLTISPVKTRKVSLFHWSWGYVITQAHLLLGNEDVTDREQRILLEEMQRFLLHPSSGVKEFDLMPMAWSDICADVAAGAAIPGQSTKAKEVVGAWHQALDHLTSVLSRQIDVRVELSLSRQQASEPAFRVRETLAELSTRSELTSSLKVPDAAAPMAICADIKKRSISASMRLRAPADRKTTKAKVTWLLRQLTRADPAGVHVRFLWPGRSDPTQHSLEALRAAPEIAGNSREGMNLLSLEVLYVKELGARFSQRRQFVQELVAGVSSFYDRVGESLSAWQAKAPRLKVGKVEPDSVSADSLREDLEQDALARTSD